MRTRAPVPMQATLLSVTQAVRIELRYAARRAADEWAIPENWPVPQSIPHSIAVRHLASVLNQWASSAGRPLFVAESLAVRWLEERPQIGIDPDLCLLDPPPEDVLDLTSLRLWKAGHHAPQLCVEIVSDHHPYKDYVDLPERYAAFGTGELAVFDPRLIGPRALGGPFAIQLWRRDETATFDRAYAGPGPVFSERMGAWLLVKDGLPQVASDREGRLLWPTEQAHERAEKERERAEKEREREARLEVERRLAALEARLGGDGKGPKSSS